MDQLKLRMGRKSVQDLMNTAPVERLYVSPGLSFLDDKVLQSVEQLLCGSGGDRGPSLLLGLGPLVPREFLSGSFFKFVDTAAQVCQHLLVEWPSYGNVRNRRQTEILRSSGSTRGAGICKQFPQCIGHLGGFFHLQT